MTSTADQKTTTLHGTAVILKSAHYPASTVFLRGFSGSGKSDLAYRLIASGGILISDDQVIFEKRDERVIAHAPKDIEGMIEVRGLGLLHLEPAKEKAPLRLVIDLIKREDVPRVPDWGYFDLLGNKIPYLQLYAFESSAPLKVMTAMEIVDKPEILVK